MLFLKAIFSILLFDISSCEINVTGDVCQCVSYHLCVGNSSITKDEAVIDVRTRTEKCSNYFEVCCKSQYIVPSNSINGVMNKNECGYRNVEGVGQKNRKKVNATQFGEFPWMIAIFHKGPNDTKHFYKCGGSLVHPQVVLTAAHCIPKEGPIKIRAGEWDRTIIEELFKHQDRDVISYVIHKKFSMNNLQNDIALLFLNSPVDINPHVNVVCLPPGKALEYSGKCFVTGWGKDKFEEIEGEQTVLKKIELSLIDKSQCQSDFRKTRLGRKFRLHRSFICAGGEEDKDACTGDGGGPLVCQISEGREQYQQVGIVSWGIGCGTKGVPGAYTDVSHLRSWIHKEMNAKNFN